MSELIDLRHDAPADARSVADGHALVAAMGPGAARGRLDLIHRLARVHQEVACLAAEVKVALYDWDLQPPAPEWADEDDRFRAYSEASGCDLLLDLLTSIGAMGHELAAGVGDALDVADAALRVRDFGRSGTLVETAQGMAAA